MFNFFKCFIHIFLHIVTFIFSHVFLCINMFSQVFMCFHMFSYSSNVPLANVSNQVSVRESRSLKVLSRWNALDKILFSKPHVRPAAKC